MGNFECARSREKDVKTVSKYGSYAARTIKEEITAKFVEMRDEYKEKYEEAKFNYKVSQSLKGNVNPSGSFIHLVSDLEYNSTKF